MKTDKQKTGGKKEVNPLHQAQKKRALWVIALSIGGLLLAVIVTAVVSYNSLARRTIEQIGMHTLGVPVAIQDVQVNAKEKTVLVTGLRIGNPAGFNSPYAITVDRIKVVVDSVDAKLLKLAELSGDKVDVYLEVNAEGTNLGALRKGANPQASNVTDDGKKPIKLAIKLLSFDDVLIHPAATLLSGSPKPVALDHFVLKDVGEQQQGVLISQMIVAVVGELTRQSLVKSYSAGYLEGVSSDALHGMGLQTGVMDRAKEGLQNLGASVKDLFGE